MSLDTQLTLLHSERPKLYTVLAFLSRGLNFKNGVPFFGQNGLPMSRMTSIKSEKFILHSDLKLDPRLMELKILTFSSLQKMIFFLLGKL